MMRGPMICALLLLAVPAFARDPIRPAELPPADYAGLQYVDTKGCMFVRAGTATEVLWVPRVSRDGTPICGNPPSGRRVPVAEEAGAAPFVPDSSAAASDPAPTVTKDGMPDVSAPGGYFVAVGSFGVAANSDRAEAKLRRLGFNVVRGQLVGGAATLITVYAGPFPDKAAASEARQALRDNGFPDAIVTGL